MRILAHEFGHALGLDQPQQLLARLAAEVVDQGGVFVRRAVLLHLQPRARHVLLCRWQRGLEALRARLRLLNAGGELVIDRLQVAAERAQPIELGLHRRLPLERTVELLSQRGRLDRPGVNVHLCGRRFRRRRLPPHGALEHGGRVLGRHADHAAFVQLVLRGADGQQPRIGGAASPAMMDQDLHGGPPWGRLSAPVTQGR